MALKMALILIKSTWNYLKEFYSVLQQSITLDDASDISAIKTMDDDILIQQEIYYIRKTKHKLHYGIYIN